MKKVTLKDHYPDYMDMCRAAIREAVKRNFPGVIKAAKPKVDQPQKTVVEFTFIRNKQKLIVKCVTENT